MLVSQRRYSSVQAAEQRHSRRQRPAVMKRAASINAQAQAESASVRTSRLSATAGDRGAVDNMPSQGKEASQVSARDDETGALLPSDQLPGSSRARKPSFQGLELSPELVAISMVYLVQGILGLSRLALTYFYKDEFHLQPATVAFLSGAGALPWLIKPLYGFLSDTVPIWGLRRRPYLILGGIVGAGSWVAMATLVNSPTAAVVAVVLGSATTACSDVVVDSIVVERSRDGPQELAGSLQSLCWASAAVGGIASAYFSGSLVQDYGPRFVFGVTALFPLVVSGAALLITEQPVPPVDPKAVAGKGQEIWERGMDQSKALWRAFSQRSILLPAVFVFLWQATPTSETAMFYFQTNKLQFTPEFLGRVRLVASIASLAGVACYNFFLKPVPLRRILLWTSLIGTVLGLTQLLLITGYNQKLGLSNELFALGDSLVLTVLGQVSFMPLLVLAARICPEGVEATLFATLMSILNGGGFTGAALGSLLTGWFGVTADKFDNLFWLVLLCTLSSLAPLPLLRLVPGGSSQDDESAAHKDSE